MYRRTVPSLRFLNFSSVVTPEPHAPQVNIFSGVTYRLGMLEGRLHGYDQKGDLLKLIQLS
jgi:hypothetical protein